MSDLFQHHAYLQAVADEDVRFILVKDTSYGASWKLAGGRSAWFMLRRKIDRMMSMMRRPEAPAGAEAALMSMPLTQEPAIGGRTNYYHVRPETMTWVREALVSEDIFAKIRQKPSGEDGSILAEVRDLRRYLLLVEAEMVAAGVVQDPTPTRETVYKSTGFGAEPILQGHNKPGYIGLRRDNPAAAEIASEGRRDIGKDSSDPDQCIELVRPNGGISSGDEWAPGVPLGADKDL